jgi:hypothetical protein
VCLPINLPIFIRVSARRSHPALARGNRLFARLDEEIGDLEEQMLTGLSPAERRRFTDTAVSCVHMLGAGLPDI